MDRTSARRIFTIALGAALLCPGRADAFHTPRRHITDGTAYTLRGNQVRVGLWKAQYGVGDSVMIGTYVLPWVILAPNAHIKWRFWQNEQLAFSFGVGFLYEDTETPSWVADEFGPAQILSVPLQVAGSWRFDDRFTLSLSPIWTLVRVEGTLDTDDLEGAGRGASDNFQTVTNLEWRLSRVTAFSAQWRFVILQREALSGGATSTPDEFTVVDASAAGDDDYEFSGAYSVTLSAIFSWRIFNLRLGVGYGNYNIAPVNFVVPEKKVFPELDVYWIW